MPEQPPTFQAPGIIGLMLSRPDLARLYSKITDMLLRGPSSLPMFFREELASKISSMNQCYFCEESHCAVSHVLMHQDPTNDFPQVKCVALSVLAQRVRYGYKDAYALVDALEAGCTAEEIHDAVLIASWFSFLNRYVTTMNPAPPVGFDKYLDAAEMIAQVGYEGALDAILEKAGAPSTREPEGDRPPKSG